MLPRMWMRNPSMHQSSRQPRPSRARGLRASTGCVTCRTRRIKCNEERPRCGQCSKSSRECHYTEPKPPRRRKVASASPEELERQPEDRATPCEVREREKTILETIPASATGFSGDAPLDPSTTTAVGRDRPPINANSLDSEYHQSLQDAASIVASAELYFSPSANTHDDLNGTALEWYDLLAQDAITNFQRDNVRHFDENTLSRRQSPAPNLPSSGSGTGESRCISAGANFTVNNDLQARLNSPPWNTEHRILLDPNESSYMQYYVDVVGPILDLLDPSRNFSEVVPHLAMYNVGLLKSLLAIAARHMALHDLELPCGNIELQSTPSDKQSRQTSQTMATQYYYETLQYLSQNLLYPSYSNSLELISTAILISTYEMFDTNDSARNGNWERHLRGCFWIQRTQDNDGEMMDRLRRAIWWAWIRQDTWAAFRAGRRTFTIFKARKRLESLTADELATRIFLIAARCVDYAASSSNTDEVAKRLERGEELLGELDRWHAVLPASFKPILTRAPTIPTVQSPWATAFHLSLVAESNPAFAPIWIHPPAHAAAIQMYNFARIIVLLHQPSTGGLNIYAKRQKMLDECVDTICGIATAQQGRQLPIALVNAQALFTAGLCVQGTERRNALLGILTQTLDISKVPHKSLVDDLTRIWNEA